MNYFELYQENPSLCLIVLLVSFVVTIFVYGAFPLIFAKTTKKSITKKKYKRLCYGLNIIGMAFFVFINGAASGAPYLLWTWIFSNWGVKTLNSRGLLKDNEQNESENNSCENAEESNEKFQQNSEIDVEKNPLQETTENLAVEQPREKCISKDIQIENKKTKVKYCSKCGSQIDPITKKCTGCDKQYFVFKKHLMTIILAVLLVVSVVVNIVFLSELNYYYDEVSSLNQQIWQLDEENEKQQNWLNVYERYVVLIEKGAQVYHKRDCKQIQSSTVNIGWKLVLDDSGYKSCPHCCE